MTAATPPRQWKAPVALRGGSRDGYEHCLAAAGCGYEESIERLQACRREIGAMLGENNGVARSSCMPLWPMGIQDADDEYDEKRKKRSKSIRRPAFGWTAQALASSQGLSGYLPQFPSS